MFQNNAAALVLTFALALSWLRLNDFAAHRGWISSQLKRAPEREERYSKSIAVGSQSFVETVQAKMGIKAVWESTCSSLCSVS